MLVKPAGRFRAWLTGGLLILLILAVATSWSTRQITSQSAAGRHDTLVDQRPWRTAEALAAGAESAEESEYAAQAEHLADHESDQAFAAALREASLHRPSLTGEALDLARKVEVLRQTVAADEALLRTLKQKDTGDDLDIAKAQLSLDSDQLTEAQQDLARAGGDERVRIRQELATHEAAMRAYDARAGTRPNPLATVPASQTVMASFNIWRKQRSRRERLLTAASEAHEMVAELTAKHNQLEKTPIAALAVQGKAERLANLSDLATHSQLLGIYDDRIATERQLASVYGKWAEQVSLQHRRTAHLLMQSSALIPFILICVIVFDSFALRLSQRPALDRRRMQTLSTILKVACQFTGMILILLVMFGRPSQMPTILGLTTAGLTLVLQDFIIAFFGWFVLMGKNGIRIGDWVEINGVAGEVVSVGLFRTAMLESGNSSDKGRPTGRRTTFINSFAIRGQYFNYSTTGQWMWDEIRVGIPPELNAYSIIDLVRREVVNETAKDIETAEGEWKRINRRFTAEPAVDMRPGASGIDLIIRYVTRASDRFEVRNRLYQRILSLLHKPPEERGPG